MLFSIRYCSNWPSCSTTEMACVGSVPPPFAEAAYASLDSCQREGFPDAGTIIDQRLGGSVTKA